MAKRGLFDVLIGEVSFHSEFFDFLFVRFEDFHDFVMGNNFVGRHEDSFFDVGFFGEFGNALVDFGVLFGVVV